MVSTGRRVVPWHRIPLRWQAVGAKWLADRPAAAALARRLPDRNAVPLLTFLALYASIDHGDHAAFRTRAEACLEDEQAHTVTVLLAIVRTASRYSDAALCHRALGALRVCADRTAARPGPAAAQLPSLIDAYACLFDLGRIADLGEAYRAAFPDLVDTVATNLQRYRTEAPNLEALSARLRADIAAARFPDEETHPDLLVYLPVLPLRTVRTGSFRTYYDLAFIYGVIVETLDEHAVPYTVVGVPARPHDALVARTLPYISHHTIGPSGAGLHIKAGNRPSHFTFDRTGFSGWSRWSDLDFDALDLPPADIAIPYVEAERERTRTANVSKYRQAALPETGDDAEGFVLVALQVSTDIVQKLAYLPMLAMLSEVSAACRRRGLPLVVKRHPFCASPEVAARLKRGVDEGEFTVSTASVNHLIPRSLAVCVVNSGVGAEALLYGKPVYAFGRAEYRAAVFEVCRPGDFDRMFEPGRLPRSAADLARFVWALHHTYAVDVADRDAARRRIRSLVLDFVGRADASEPNHKISGGT